MRKFKVMGKRIVQIATCAFMLVMTLNIKVLASEKPIFISGTERLVSDLLKYLVGGAALLTGFLLVVQGYKWNLADEQEKPRQQKKFFTILFVGVGIVLSTAIVTWVFSYYV